MKISFRPFILLCLPVLLIANAVGQVPLRYQEGTVQGFLILRSLDDEILASGDSVQVARGNRVTINLTFHFKDGSLYEETTVFTQHRNFHLLSDHSVRKGPSFPKPLDVTIDAVKGQVTVRSLSDEDKEDAKPEHMQLPPNLANGIVSTLLKNVSPQSTNTTLSMVVATPKPRLVKLVFSSQGEDTFIVAGSKHKATHFAAKIELGGIAGIVAPVIGKQAPDTHVWIATGEAPTFVRLESQFFENGPIWRIELASPTWPQGKEDKEEKK